MKKTLKNNENLFPTCLGSVTVPSTSNKHKISFLSWDILDTNHTQRNKGPTQNRDKLYSKQLCHVSIFYLIQNKV
jgi:hypothetical protein